MVIIVCLILAVMIEKAWSEGRAKVAEQWANAAPRIAKGGQSTEWGRRAATMTRGALHAARGTAAVARGIGAVAGAAGGGMVAGYRTARDYLDATRAAGQRPTVAGARAHARPTSTSPTAGPSAGGPTSPTVGPRKPPPTPGGCKCPNPDPDHHHYEPPREGVIHDSGDYDAAGPASTATPAPTPAPDPYADAVVVDAEPVGPDPAPQPAAISVPAPTAIAAGSTTRGETAMSVYDLVKANLHNSISSIRSAADSASAASRCMAEMHMPGGQQATVIDLVTLLVEMDARASLLLAHIQQEHDHKAEALAGQAAGTSQGYGAIVG